MIRKKMFNILVTGVGGQGVLSVSRVIASAAAQVYPYVCRIESRGLSQRGGAVSATIRFGEEAATPLVGLESADLMLAFDALEAVRSLPFLHRDGVLVTNARFIPPQHLTGPIGHGSHGGHGGHESHRGNRAQEKPDGHTHSSLTQSLQEVLQGQRNIFCLDLPRLAQEAHLAKVLNTVYLGAASHFQPLPLELLRSAVLETFQPADGPLNIRGLDFGFETMAQLTQQRLSAFYEKLGLPLAARPAEHFVI